MIDCADPDCSGDPFCTAGGLCPGAIAIACNASTTGSTSAGPNLIDRYACDPWIEAGREQAYALAPHAGSITVDLTGLTHDLDLIVVEGCDPRACVAASSTTNTSETVTFTAQADRAYFAIVDGMGPTSGTFTLTVTCP